MFQYCFEYRVALYGESVVYLVPVFGFSVNVKFFKSVERKGKMLDTLEKFYIYRETKNGNQINDRLTIPSNPIFETILKHSPQGGQHI